MKKISLFKNSNLLILIGIISSVWLILWGWFNNKVFIGLGIVILFNNISVLINKYKKAA